MARCGECLNEFTHSSTNSAIWNFPGKVTHNADGYGRGHEFTKAISAEATSVKHLEQSYIKGRDEEVVRRCAHCSQLKRAHTYRACPERIEEFYEHLLTRCVVSLCIHSFGAHHSTNCSHKISSPSELHWCVEHEPAPICATPMFIIAGTDPEKATRLVAELPWYIRNQVKAENTVYVEAGVVDNVAST